MHEVTKIQVLDCLTQKAIQKVQKCLQSGITSIKIDLLNDSKPSYKDDNKEDANHPTVDAWPQNAGNTDGYTVQVYIKNKQLINGGSPSTYNTMKTQMFSPTFYTAVFSVTYIIVKAFHIKSSFSRNIWFWSEAISTGFFRGFFNLSTVVIPGVGITASS